MPDYQQRDALPTLILMECQRDNFCATTLTLICYTKQLDLSNYLMKGQMGLSSGISLGPKPYSEERQPH